MKQSHLIQTNLAKIICLIVDLSLESDRAHKGPGFCILAVDDFPY